MRSSRVKRARTDAEGWARDALRELTAGAGDYAQADLDELTRLRRSDDLAELSIEMFAAIMGVLVHDGGAAVSARLDVPLDIDAAEPLVDVGDLLAAAVWPPNRRGRAIPGFLLERFPGHETTTHGDLTVRALDAVEIHGRAVLRRYVFRHDGEERYHSLVLSFSQLPVLREVSVPLRG